MSIIRWWILVSTFPLETVSYIRNTVRDRRSTTEPLNQVSTGSGMGNRLHAGKPSWYVTSHPGQLSLAIPLLSCES